MTISNWVRSRFIADPFDAARVRRGRPLSPRAHYLSGVLGDWFHAEGIKSIYLVGVGDGRYLHDWWHRGFIVAGCELQPSETPYRLAPGIDWSRYVIHRCDALALTPAMVQDYDVLVSDACFEAMVPWRKDGTSTIPKYAGGGPIDQLGAWVQRLAVPRWAFVEPDLPSLRAQWGEPWQFATPLFRILSPSTDVICALYASGLSRPYFVLSDE